MACLRDHAIFPDSLMSSEARSLRQLSVQQWKTGIAAWLGWFFDGLELHLYTLVAAPFVMQLLHASSTTDPEVKSRSSWIQAAFLVGWALGGGFFGRIGDKLGRARALSLTVLTYAAFTGISFFAHTWWQLFIFRFIAALGIGGEWAVGAALLSETWPRSWRPWIAAVLQCGVNMGILIACAAVVGLTHAAPWLQAHFGGYLPAGWTIFPRCVFLLGVIPAILVWWLRRNVSEPEEWKAAQAERKEQSFGIRDLFGPATKRITILSMIVCGTSLSGWWAFMFWHPQHISNLPELASWTNTERSTFMQVTFFTVVGVSVFGNFFAGWLARHWGYRRSIATMFGGMFFCLAAAQFSPQEHHVLLAWYSGVGFFSGVFGLFTMYLPPLFPTLLRTTGAGFSYNIGRIAAAYGVVQFGLFSKVGDFRTTLLCSAALFLPGLVAVLLMPEPPDETLPERKREVETEASGELEPAN